LGSLGLNGILNIFSPKVVWIFVQKIFGNDGKPERKFEGIFMRNLLAFLRKLNKTRKRRCGKILSSFQKFVEFLTFVEFSKFISKVKSSFKKL
jgi:hypothetical protein